MQNGDLMLPPLISFKKPVDIFVAEVSLHRSVRSLVANLKSSVISAVACYRETFILFKRLLVISGSSVCLCIVLVYMYTIYIKSRSNSKLDIQHWELKKHWFVST